MHMAYTTTSTSTHPRPSTAASSISISSPPPWNIMSSESTLVSPSELGCVRGSGGAGRVCGVWWTFGQEPCCAVRREADISARGMGVVRNGLGAGLLVFAATVRRGLLRTRWAAWRGLVWVSLQEDGFFPPLVSPTRSLPAGPTGVPFLLLSESGVLLLRLDDRSSDGALELGRLGSKNRSRSSSSRLRSVPVGAGVEPVVAAESDAEPRSLRGRLFDDSEVEVRDADAPSRRGFCVGEGRGSGLPCVSVTSSSPAHRSSQTRAPAASHRPGPR